MKVIVNDSKDNIEYPCLMIGPSDEIVLFLEEEAGTCIAGKEYEIGHYSDAWIMELFKPFNGSVTLGNES